jgi:DNA-binding CsgD family transcriptional regulator
MRYDPRTGPGLTPQLEAVLEIFDAHNAIVYCPEARAAGWELEFSEWAGRDSEQRRAAHRELVRAAPPDAPNFAAYDPFVVEKAQRNRTLTIRELVALEPAAAGPHRRLWEALDARQEDEVRVLVCRGPRLLGWFGMVRETPFSRGEVRAFHELVEPLRQRLLAEHATRAGRVEQSLLDAVLELVPEPCFVFGPGARIEFANAPALEMLETGGEPRACLESLREAVLRGRKHADFTLTSLAERGCPGYLLAVQTRRTKARASAVGRACRAWKVTGVRAAVLERLAAGGSNKEIAVALGTTEVSVERHVTALFRASKTRSRAELLSRLFDLAAPGLAHA